MLSSDELAQLVGAICATAETLGQTISASAAEMIAGDLAYYSVADLAAALKACRRELTGRLTLAAIMQRVQAADGRPDPNEAWGIAVASADEFDSVVTTDEIQLAFGAARSILEAGDKIGARMAFLSAYTRCVDTARKSATPVNWSLSMGFDQQRRLVAVQEGVRLGRLSHAAGGEYAMQLTHEPISADGLAIAGLLTGKPVAPPSQELRAKWQQLKQDVAEKKAARIAQQKAEQRAQREDLERRRNEHQAAIEIMISKEAAKNE